jgi:hypothetical protein
MGMNFRGIKLGLIMSAALALSACATIMGQPTQVIPISSAPSDAAISIRDESGAEVFSGTTPTTVTLFKSTGRYWGKKEYRVTITKKGFQPQIIPVTASANGWYIVGNAFVGGVIGWFVIDPQSGNMYTLSPEVISANLSQSTAHNNKAQDGSIAIVLLQDVPEGLRDQMVRVH